MVYCIQISDGWMDGWHIAYTLVMDGWMDGILHTNFAGGRGIQAATSFVPPPSFTGPATS